MQRRQGLVLLLLATTMVAAWGEEASARVVRTRQGAARGRLQASSSGRRLLAFYNLPYAKPPVGPLRFRDPQPPDEWVHIRDATTPGTVCIQNDVFFFNSGQAGAEDCLYLNVFTPKISQSDLLPVMFWIHGGGFFYGGGTTYGPDFLLDHDVVLVTSNYRLGTFGFLSTEDESAPGNFGLKDQLAALKWVHDNIAAFGGDASKVTIFGESAGAASAHYHGLSPLSRGLFHRIIMQSGNNLAPWAMSRTGAVPARARKLASRVGCPAEPSGAMVECLRGVDDFRLLNTDMMSQDASLLMLPVVEGAREGAFIPKHPLHLKPAEVEWLVGVTENEGALQAAALYANSTVFKNFEDNLNQVLPTALFYETAPNADIITQKIRSYYFPTGRVPLKEITALFSDAMIFWSTDETLRILKDQVPVFYYLLRYRGMYRAADPNRKIDFDFGAGHTDDLFYLFPKNPFYPGDYKLPEEDMKFANTITKLWTNFAKTGNPTPDDEPLHWPTLTSDEMEYMDLNQELKVMKGMVQRRLQFWRSLPFRDEEKGQYSRVEL